MSSFQGVGIEVFHSSILLLKFIFFIVDPPAINPVPLVVS